MQHVNRAEGCLSELALDEWASGELTGAERARLEEHLASCDACRARHATLEADRAAFLATAPSFATYAEQIGAARLPRQGWRPLQRVFVAATSGMMLAATALLVVWTGSPSEETRSKGAPHVTWFVKRGEQVHRGRTGETLNPGDSLRFVYSSDAPRFLALFNLDAHKASVYYPSAPDALRVRAGNDIALDFSVELDALLGTERVYAMFCEETFRLEPLRAALFETGRLPERAGCRSDVITLRKVARE